MGKVHGGSKGGSVIYVAMGVFWDPALRAIRIGNGIQNISAGFKLQALSASKWLPNQPVSIRLGDEL